MVFSSFIFLFLFLPVVLGGYFASPRSLKNGALLAASITFYAWGAPEVLPFLLAGCCVDYGASLRLVPGIVSERARSRILAASVGLNLLLLAYFKYANFFLAEFGGIFRLFGVEPSGWPEVLLPIGISFFTFHKITYLVDVYRGESAPARTIFDYLLYVLFFPQLIAGPIVRYSDVGAQLVSRRHSVDLAFEGMLRFVEGLGKKVLVADYLGGVADHVFGMSTAALAPGTVWLGAVCYSFQIFFDFSGYSDMAIGLARVFGIRFKENFRQPYRATSITDFWKRWHISLTSFMREYLYIPLGGNRVSTFRTHLNLWFVFLVSGLWHGASWNFVVWGLYHGLFLTLDRLGLGAIIARLPVAARIGSTFFVVTIGWVFFRADTLARAVALLSIMFGIGPDSVAGPMARAALIDNRALCMLGVAAVLALLPERVDGPDGWLPRGVLRTVALGTSALLIFAVSASALAARGYTPFLYFKF